MFMELSIWNVIDYKYFRNVYLTRVTNTCYRLGIKTFLVLLLFSLTLCFWRVSHFFDSKKASKENSIITFISYFYNKYWWQGRKHTHTSKASLWQHFAVYCCNYESMKSEIGRKFSFFISVRQLFFSSHLKWDFWSQWLEPFFSLLNDESKSSLFLSLLSPTFLLSSFFSTMSVATRSKRKKNAK